MAITIGPLSYRSVVIVDPLTGNQANVSGGALSTSGGGGTSSTNITQWAGTAVDTNNGAVSAGTLRVTIANNSTGQVALAAGSAAIGSLTAGTAIIGKVGIDQTTPGTTNGVQVNAALPAGTNVIGALSANQSVNVAQLAGTATSVNNGTVDAGTLRVTLASNGTGQVVLAAGSAAIGSLTAGTAVIGQVNLAPQTSGGLTMYHAVVPNNVTGVVVKNTAGQVYGVSLSNVSTTVTGFLKFYDSSSAPTAGSGTIKHTLLVPFTPAGAGAASYQFPNGLAFASGIAYTFTTVITDADATVPAASTYSIDISYK